MIEKILSPRYAFQILDIIDLNIVEKSIKEKNYEEDLLNQDMEFRTEVEGSIRSYFQIFINTSQHTRSFKKYERRIKDIGIKIPETVRLKIKEYFEQDTDKNECTVKIEKVK